MLTLLMSLHNLLASCCGPAGNVFAKVFQHDEEDQPAPAPAAAAAAPAGASAAPKPSAAGGKQHGFFDKQAKFEDVSWNKLPLSTRRAAKAIGFDKPSWDGKEWLPIDDKWWGDLTPEEKKAGETLGWDEKAWDTKYEDVEWKDLPKHVQKAAEKLGWTQQTWDEDWDTPTWHKGWNEFSEEERRCLHVLGYYVHTWD